MEAIRIRRHLDSDTPHLPELRPLVGRDVEFIVLAESGSTKSGKDPARFLAAAGKIALDPNSLDDLRRASQL